MNELYTLKDKGMYLSTATPSGWTKQLGLDCVYADRSSVEQIQQRYPGSQLITIKLTEIDDDEDA